MPSRGLHHPYHPITGTRIVYWLYISCWPLGKSALAQLFGLVENEGGYLKQGLSVGWKDQT